MSHSGHFTIGKAIQNHSGWQIRQTDPSQSVNENRIKRNGVHCWAIRVYKPLSMMQSVQNNCEMGKCTWQLACLYTQDCKYLGNIHNSTKYSLEIEKIMCIRSHSTWQNKATNQSNTLTSDALLKLKKNCLLAFLSTLCFSGETLS